MKKNNKEVKYVSLILLLLILEIFTLVYFKSKINYWENRNKFDIESFHYEYDSFGFDRIEVIVDNNGDAYLRDNVSSIDIEEDIKDLYKTYTIDTITSTNRTYSIKKTLIFKGYKFDIKNVTNLFGISTGENNNNFIYIFKLAKNKFYYIDYLSIINNHDYELKKLNGLSNIVSIYNKAEEGIYAKNSSGKEIEISDYFTEIYNK